MEKAARDPASHSYWPSSECYCFDMSLWILIFISFIVQEPVTASGILFEAYRRGYDVWLIHSIFLVCTSLDILIGYAVGSFLNRRFAHTRPARFIRRKADGFVDCLGKYGHRITLIVIAPILFPLSSLLPPLLGISLGEAFVCLLLGEIIFWYSFIWCIVLGVQAFGLDPRVSLYVVIATAIVLLLMKHYGWKYLRRPRI